MTLTIQASIQPDDFGNSYAASFVKARAIIRHHHFYVGPTNSGKTYHALNALMAAKSHMLSIDDTSNLSKLPIAPNFSQMAKIANKMHTGKLAECLEFFTQKLTFNHAHFELSSVAAQHAQALLVDEFAPKMALKDKFIFACAPISINTTIEKDCFLMCLQSAYTLTSRALPTTPTWLTSNSQKHFNSKYLEAAESLSQNISLYA